MLKKFIKNINTIFAYSIDEVIEKIMNLEERNRDLHKMVDYLENLVDINKSTISESESSTGSDYEITWTMPVESANEFADIKIKLTASVQNVSSDEELQISKMLEFVNSQSDFAGINCQFRISVNDVESASDAVGRFAVLSSRNFSITPNNVIGFVNLINGLEYQIEAIKNANANTEIEENDVITDDVENPNSDENVNTGDNDDVITPDDDDVIEDDADVSDSDISEIDIWCHWFINNLINVFNKFFGDKWHSYTITSENPEEEVIIMKNKIDEFNTKYFNA